MKQQLKLILALLAAVIVLGLIAYRDRIDSILASAPLDMNDYTVETKNKNIVENTSDIKSGEKVLALESSGDIDDLFITSFQAITYKGSTPYYIRINNAQNVVTIYAKDENGNYSIPYKAMVCSVGEATPKAGKTHKITTYKQRWNGLQGNVYGQYATQIVGNILFHSVPYTAKNNSSLEYWEYDKLGTAASLGCIRLTVEDAKWIYDNISAGTVVEFYEDENPGPLGKPVSKIISDNELCRNWDPTDTASGNPWNMSEERMLAYAIESFNKQNNILAEENAKKLQIKESSSTQKTKSTTQKKVTTNNSEKQKNVVSVSKVEDGKVQSAPIEEIKTDVEAESTMEVENTNDNYIDNTIIQEEANPIKETQEIIEAHEEEVIVEETINENNIHTSLEIIDNDDVITDKEEI